jgi:hypothetical protein
VVDAVVLSLLVHHPNVPWPLYYGKKKKKKRRRLAINKIAGRGFFLSFSFPFLRHCNSFLFFLLFTQSLSSYNNLLRNPLSLDFVLLLLLVFLFLDTFKVASFLS